MKHDVHMKRSRLFENFKLWATFIFLSLIIGLSIALFSGILQFRQNDPVGFSLDDFRSHFEVKIPRLMKQYEIPGCNIALVHDFEIVWNQGFGYADVASGRFLTKDSVMSVQSITKSTTAWGVLKLNEENLINLDDPLSRYLKTWQFPPSDYPTENMTIRHLLSHTAGMPLGDFTDIYAPGELMPALKDKLTQEAVLMRQPGAGFSYSNIGYNLLELLIEEVTGQSYSDYMRSEIFEPLGMETATFDSSEISQANPPTGYNLRGEAVPVYVYAEKASGGLFATAGDIARFAAAGMRGNTELTDERIHKKYAPESQNLGFYGLVFDAYGMGHYIETLPNDMLSVSHGGQGNGIMTHFQVVPESGDAIVILTNSQRSWPFISSLLRDWARWRMFPSVGMEKIIWGQYGLCAIIGILFSASCLIIFIKILTVCRHKQSRLKRVRIGASILLLGILIWCASQTYLMITSVFPILSGWLGYATLAFSVALLISAFPFRRKEATK